MTNPIKSREEILSAMEGFPEELGRVIFSNEEPDALTKPASDGGWGVVEILPHLRDWEEIFYERLMKVANEEHPYLPGVDDTLWSIERDYRGQDPRETFDRLTALREATVEHLRSLGPEGWARTGEHGYYGEVSVQWIGDHMVKHDQEHLQQARDALSA